MDGSSYDAASKAAQTFTVSGTVSLPAGVVNTNGVFLTTSISVTVDAAPVTDKVLLSITPPSAVTGVANGAAKTAAALGLPTAVTLVTDGGSVQATVTWDVAGSSYGPGINVSADLYGQRHGIIARRCRQYKQRILDNRHQRHGGRRACPQTRCC